MKAHPAFPQLDQFGWISPEARGIERGIAQPTAQNDAQRAIEEQVISMTLRHGRASRFDRLGNVPVTQQDADQIGQ